MLGQESCKWYVWGVMGAFLSVQVKLKSNKVCCHGQCKVSETGTVVCGEVFTSVYPYEKRFPLTASDCCQLCGMFGEHCSRYVYSNQIMHYNNCTIPNGVKPFQIYGCQLIIPKEAEGEPPTKKGIGRAVSGNPLSFNGGRYIWPHVCSFADSFADSNIKIMQITSTDMYRYQMSKASCFRICALRYPDCKGFWWSNFGTISCELMHSPVARENASEMQIDPRINYGAVIGKCDCPHQFTRFGNYCLFHMMNKQLDRLNASLECEDINPESNLPIWTNETELIMIMNAVSTFGLAIHSFWTGFRNHSGVWYGDMTFAGTFCGNNSFGSLAVNQTTECDCAYYSQGRIISGNCSEIMDVLLCSVSNMATCGPFEQPIFELPEENRTSSTATMETLGMNENITSLSTGFTQALAPLQG